MKTETRKHKHLGARIIAALAGVLVVIVIIAAATSGAKPSGAASAAQQIAAHPHGAVARAYWQQRCTQNPHQNLCVGIVNPDGTPGPDWARP